MDSVDAQVAARLLRASQLWALCASVKQQVWLEAVASERTIQSLCTAIMVRGHVDWIGLLCWTLE